MMGHNICFVGVIWKNIPKLSLSSLLIWNTDDARVMSLSLFLLVFLCT